VLLRCGSAVLDLTRPVVMGVLNVTPDSFSDGGRFDQANEAVAHGVRMAEEGAAILDVGGESTRPGAAEVTAEEQIRRVIPVIKQLRQQTAAIISVDTSKPAVMAAAVAAGAQIINDVRALREPGALDMALQSPCAVCLMHMQGDPRTMQLAPAYKDVVAEVRAFLLERVHSCLAAGFAPERLAIDPGFGFGKTLEHNLGLLRHLALLNDDPGPPPRRWPLLAGLSRKAIVGHLTGRAVAERASGSVALAILAVLNGASIVRVHDVAATVDALKIVAAVKET
jgi:dihydropteroate synthase